MSKQLPILCLFIGLFFTRFGQSDIDPLVAALDTAQGKSRLNIIEKLIETTAYRNPKGCLVYGEEGLELSNQILKEKKELWRIENNIFGYMSFALNNLDREEEALKMIEKMVVNADSLCAQTIGVCMEKGKVFGYFGSYYFKNHNFDKAIENQKKALAIYSNLNGNTVPALMNLGMAYERGGYPDSAIYYKQLGKTKLKSMGAPQKILTKADFELAMAYMVAEKIDSASKFINQVIDTCKKYDYALHRKSQMVGAGINNAAGNYEYAWQLLNDSRKTIIASGHLEDISMWYNHASVCTKELGMLDSTLHFTEQRMVYRDSLYELNLDESIAKAEESIEVKSRELEIKGLTNQLSTQENLVGLLSLLLLIGGIGFLFFYFKNKKSKEKNTLEIRYFLGDNSTIKSESELNEFVKVLLKTIDENLSEGTFNVEALARKLFVSRSNLFKKVKAQTGKTPVALIREMRMEKAKLLLEKNKVSIKEIAAETGYDDPSYFTKVFKSYFGKSPSEFLN